MASCLADGCIRANNEKNVKRIIKKKWNKLNYFVKCLFLLNILFELFWLFKVYKGIEKVNTI